MSSSSLPQLLPWNDQELERILRDLIALGTELPKADFKAELEHGTWDQKAELLKDISAIANTFDDEHYEDYGFLIYGVSGKAINGVATTATDTDNLQNTLEQLLKTYISPMPQIHVIGFEAQAGRAWGVVVIPPRNTKPHMFVREILHCQDPKRNRKRADWFVRRGATTEPGLPEDLEIITQRQLQLTLEPIRTSIQELQFRIGRIEQQSERPLVQLGEGLLQPNSGIARPEAADAADAALLIQASAAPADLASRFRQALRKPSDALAEDLLLEARRLRAFLAAPDSGIPWAPEPMNAAVNRGLIEDLEARTRTLQSSIAAILLNDDNGTYADAVLRVFRTLAHHAEAPAGTMFNILGEPLRYYPLAILVYTAFVCGGAAGKGELLKKLLQTPIQKRRAEGEGLRITRIFFALNRAVELFNNAFEQRWCEPIVMRIRETIRPLLAELLPDVDEPECFFSGEFALALAPIDLAIYKDTPVADRKPLPGLYLYLDEANDAIKRLLWTHSSWLEQVYSHPLAELLESFDRNAASMARFGCIPTGLEGLNTVFIHKTYRP